ncbi:PspC domain-containing protein [Georgenia alba]|uniref:PspC domain-containing protein n=1 Tax=Georgenia alba TaxID=2233858 RepID=A0ABW2QCI0_9MICO
MTPVTASAAPVTGRLPLRRPRRGRRIAGVCAGVAAHLGLPVRWVRAGFAVSALLVVGLLMYLWLWVTVPVGDPSEAGRPTALGRLAPRLRDNRTGSVTRDVVLAVVLLLIAVQLLVWRVVDGGSWLLPALLVAAGAALAWGQLAAAARGQSTRGTVMVRVVAGVLLAVIGALLVVAPGRSFVEMVEATLAGMAVVAGVAVVLAPLLLRLVRELGSEREARARESERADIAAHLHDSVLQTLALIRARSGDDDVGRLARAQERELRQWLYTDRPEPGSSTAEVVRRVAAEVEDVRGVPIDVVTAGDAVPDPGTETLSAATREALTNAVVHGRAPVSLYVEVTPDGTEVFVRDRGDGFELDAVPEDRHGVRRSIIDRMERHGGRATVRSTDSGTEVHLVMPRKGQS